MNPFFSVIIPCYNREALISRTIESVLAQNYQDFELILVDDGSTDKTSLIIRNYSNQNDKIRLIQQTNSERGCARNRGWKESKGKWICFLDSDDLLLPEHLSILRNAIENNPELHLFATKYEFLDNEKVFTSPMNRLNEGTFSYSILVTGNPFACNVTIRNNHPDNIIFREERIFSSMEDWIFLFSNLWTRDLFLIDEITIWMREHESRSMRNHLLVAERRINAMGYILNHFSLNRKEKKQLKGFSYYFCGIHYYLEAKRRKAFIMVIKSILHLGIKKDILKLMVKIIIGRKAMLRIKGLFYSDLH